ncbi:MAG: hypothetical protein KatS3mg042_1141 [Rhodothermaceae bacterium]|nr:MAG: hypothetical protein KatS3mg042_1141 [Rhodothermaceae bacterium]
MSPSAYRALCLLIALALGTSVARTQPLVVRHVTPDARTGAENDYFVELLDLALRKAGKPYRREVSPLDLYQGRALILLQRGEALDVVWTMTSAEREAMPGIRPIRFALQQGLIGYRLLLVNAADTARFCALDDPAELKHLTAGQQHDWPDTQILQANGFRVVTAPSYQTLFRMLQHRRFDYFPRSVLEIWDEAARYAGQGLVVDRCLLIQYPAAVYFFVREEDVELAERLETGLQRALEDGSYRALFLEHYGAALQQARLHARRRIVLENPLLPPGTRIAPTLRPEN